MWRWVIPFKRSRVSSSVRALTHDASSPLRQTYVETRRVQNVLHLLDSSVRDQMRQLNVLKGAIKGGMGADLNGRGTMARSPVFTCDMACPVRDVRRCDVTEREIRDSLERLDQLDRTVRLCESRARAFQDSIREICQGNTS